MTDDAARDAWDTLGGPPSESALQALRERTVLGSLDIRIVEAGPTGVTLEMPVGPKVHQPYGLLHGGVSAVLAETGASIGAWLAAGPDRRTFGISITANHLRPVTEGMVRSVSVPIRQGRSVAVWETRIEDEQERLVCISHCTVAVRDA